MNSDDLRTVLLALISLIGAIATTIIPVYLDILRRRLKEVKEDVHTVKLATNSLTDRLVESTAISERAKGKLEGAAEERGKDQPKVDDTRGHHGD